MLTNKSSTFLEMVVLILGIYSRRDKFRKSDNQIIQAMISSLSTL